MISSRSRAGSLAGAVGLWLLLPGAWLLASLNSHPGDHDVGRTQEVSTAFDEIHAHVLKRPTAESAQRASRPFVAQRTVQVVQGDPAAAR